MRRTVASSLLLGLLLLAGPVLAQDPRPLPPVVATEFDPRRDGLPFANNGDFASWEGNCWGMSLLAIDNYLRRLERGREAEREPVRPITSEVQEQDYFEEMAAVALLQEYAERRDGEGTDAGAPASDPAPLRAALLRIASTGEPEVMGMFDAEGSGHAIVLFGRDRDGSLLIYDSNYPGETIRWPWHPVRGLGRHPKARDPEADGLYRGVATVSSTPFRQHRSATDLRWIRAACEARDGMCMDRFPRVDARMTSARDGSRLFVHGSVTGGLERDHAGNPAQRPGRVWVVVDGRPVGMADLGRDGTFNVALPPGAYRPTSRVRVVAATDDGAFAGFGEAIGAIGVPPAPGRTPGLAGLLERELGR